MCVSSYAGENSMAPSCVRKLTVIELKLNELIAKPHAYVLGPSDLQLPAECRRSSLIYDRSHNCVLEYSTPSARRNLPRES